MNSAGQFVVVAESIASVPTYQLLLYNPTFDGDRINGFEAPILIADAGPGRRAGWTPWAVRSCWTTAWAA